MTLAERTILIIGGASGFGYAVATAVAKAGARVIVTSRSAAKSAEAAARLRANGGDVLAAVADAADEAELARVSAGLGPIDHLVSMAGGFMGGGFLDAPFETIRKAVEDKLFANLRIARLAAPQLRDGGSMVFTAGSGGRPHNASGAIVGNDAIRTLVRGLAVEVAPRLRVNAVAPTWTRTPLWDFMSAEQIAATEARFAGTIPLGRTARIEEVSAAYVFLMENTFVTGQTIAVDGGVSLVS